MKLYPLQFNPIFKDRIWGGTKLKTILNKPITSDFTGESWEISTVENNVSVISNGEFKGKSLNELIDLYPEDVLGTFIYKKFGKQFPLLLKYLDARQDLSIQVHPDDYLAKKRHNSFGKTEMWYVIQADKNSKLIVGFKNKSSKDAYSKSLKDKTILNLLDSKNIDKGDVFFINSGTVHAIGAGILIAEIQQTSDITYRLYDFDRKDTNGNLRELHEDLALEAINYDVVDAQKLYSQELNISNSVVACDYFKTNVIQLNNTMSVLQNQQTFRVYMCTEGNFELTLNDNVYKYKIGDTVLIPASTENFVILGKATILEIYIS